MIVLNHFNLSTIKKAIVAIGQLQMSNGLYNIYLKHIIEEGLC